MATTPTMKRPGRWTLIAGVGLVALGVLAINAYATFTGTATVNQAAITAGHMELTVPAAGASNRLTLGASGLAPGDTMSRALDLDVDASTTSGIMTGIELSISATNTDGKNLGTDATDGLKIWIAKCSVAWTESGSSPAYTYTCGGTQSDVLGTSGSPVAVASVSSSALSNLSVSPGATNYLMLKLTFPSSADDSFQDATTSLSFAFSGVQRAGTDQ
jgi:hypothetical protein